MEKTFIYNASALAIGGTFTRPIERVINVPASSTLPREGGYNTARTGKYRLEEFLSFESAYTQVAGSQDPKDKSFTSLASATVEGLNILDVLTADRVVAQLAVNHPADGGEPEIVPLGTRFDNLRIAGCPIKVDLDLAMFTTLGTFSSFRDRYAKDRGFRDQARQRFLWDKMEEDAPPETDGTVCCSLTRRIVGLDTSIERRGYKLRIPQFGTVYIAEIFLSPKRRKITMLRLDLGSPAEARMSVGEVDGNGSTFP
jgi:hypothetical protein